MNYCNGVKLGLCDYAYPLPGLGGAGEEQGCGLEIMRECFILNALARSLTESTHTSPPKKPDTKKIPARKHTFFGHEHQP